MPAEPREPLFDPKPAVVGHRGFGRGKVTVPAVPAGDAGELTTGTAGGERVLVENTVESYLAAVEAGLRWVEVDVQRTADDRLVVRHDPSTPDGEFLVERTEAELRERGIVSFHEVMEALPPEVHVNVDVKTVIEDAVDDPARRTGALLSPVLAAEARRRRLFVSSFDPSLVLHLKEQVPGLALGLIAWINFPLRHAVAAAANMGLAGVCLHTGSFGLNRIENRPVHRSPEYSVEIAHRAGLEVLAWCPDASAAPDYAAAGVDAICVNDVPGTLAALRGDAAGPGKPAGEAGENGEGGQPAGTSRVE
jgi:glycerophosphoryl diester phosphodiesterase